MKFKQQSSETVYQGRVFDLQRQQWRYPDGSQVEIDVISHAGAVAILPQDDEGQLVFIRQFRPAIDDWLLEIPAGRLEADEEPEASAQRELREETGLRAAWLQPLGRYYPAAGYSSEVLHLFLAGGLSEDPLEQDEDEVIEIERLSVGEAQAMAADGRIHDGKTLIALAWAAEQLGG